MRELLRYARQDLGLKSIKARVLSHNKRALKLYESFGIMYQLQPTSIK